MNVELHILRVEMISGTANCSIPVRKGNVLYNTAVSSFAKTTTRIKVSWARNYKRKNAEGKDYYYVQWKGNIVE